MGDGQSVLRAQGARVGFQVGFYYSWVRRAGNRHRRGQRGPHHLPHHGEERDACGHGRRASAAEPTMWMPGPESRGAGPHRGRQDRGDQAGQSELAGRRDS